MRTTSSLLLALPALASAAKCKPYVDSEKLQELITLDDLLAGSQKLQDFADAHGGNRAFGGGGHNATADWLYETLDALEYYDVIKQPFTELFSRAEGSLNVDGVVIESAGPMTYTPGGSITGPLVAVANLGCDAADYPAEVAGKIAYILRGTCSFGAKSLAAKAAGASAVVIHNWESGAISGTLGTPLLDYAPTFGISLEEAEPITAALAAGEEVVAEFEIDAVTEERVNYNVVAETRGGDHDNVLVLGGHSDSVYAGPGINDDGSGTVGVLNTAIALSKFRVKNAVRFAWFGAEEFGKLGSFYYVKQLNSSDVEMAKMRAYLNFDMIASPNYVYAIYDGDGGAFNFSGPPGSAEIEKEFEEFYERKGAGHVPAVWTGRSDYAAFIENGIPSGGLFTGAEEIKTEEEAALFGGEVGVAYDINYHKIGDDINNLAHDAYLLNAKSIANSVAKYAMSWESLPDVDLNQRRWNADRAQLFKRTGSHGHDNHHGGPCGGGELR